MNLFIGSSSRVEDDKYLQLAYQVSNKLSDTYDLVCGGITTSMMKIIYNNFRDKNKKVTCVTLGLYHENLDNVDSKYLVDNTFDRLKKIYEISDIFLILPGGSGTISELFGLLEEIRTVDNNKKLYIYNYDGYYDFVKEFLNDSINYGFNSKSIMDYVKFIDNIDEIGKEE